MSNNVNEKNSLSDLIRSNLNVDDKVQIQEKINKLQNSLPKIKLKIDFEQVIEDITKFQASLSKINFKIGSEQDRQDITKLQAVLSKINFNINSNQTEEDMLKLQDSFSNISKMLPNFQLQDKLGNDTMIDLTNSNDKNIKTNILHKDSSVFNDLSNLITYAFITLSVGNFSKYIIDSLELFNAADKLYIKYASTLLKCGWTPTSHVTLSAIKNVIEIYNKDLKKNVKQKSIDDYLVTFYDGDILHNILDKWKKKRLLTKRINILESIINAHIEGNYNLTIPVILAQIEGIIADGFYHKGDLHEPRYKTYLTEILSASTNVYYDKLLVDFFVTKMMVSFKHGIAIASNTSRHAILHGADVKYGTKENSLKLILFFDFLQDKFIFFSLKDSDYYHIVGCNKVSPIFVDIEKNPPTTNLEDYFITENIDKKGRRKINYFMKHISFYKTQEDAINSSKLPCEYCINHK